jgi:hypothetical protein
VTRHSDFVVIACAVADRYHHRLHWREFQPRSHLVSLRFGRESQSALP